MDKVDRKKMEGSTGIEVFPEYKLTMKDQN